MRPASIGRSLAILALLLPLAGVESSCSTSSEEVQTVGPAVGTQAPEIEGDDLDGRALKLSDLRGKVVLLAFWGDWWTPCRVLYAHQRTLLEKFADKPFEIVGVNSDTQLPRLKQVLERQKIGWRSFWNGPKGPAGPIAREWGVGEWPMVCVIDAKGKIRYRANGAEIEPLERALTRVLAELDTPVGDAK
jgi:thiol-disulfide isomerase/thioredoxin